MSHHDHPGRLIRLAHRLGVVRCSHDRLLGGVCAGLARRTGVNAWVFRALFIAGNFLPGPGLVIYLLLWLTLPLED